MPLRGRNKLADLVNVRQRRKQTDRYVISERAEKKKYAE
jgi:hypothetical protein